MIDVNFHTEFAYPKVNYPAVLYKMKSPMRNFCKYWSDMQTFFIIIVCHDSWQKLLSLDLRRVGMKNIEIFPEWT